jgi:hypothetical protein
MGKAIRKPRPSPPRWFFWDNDNCWFCKNRRNCGNCSLCKKVNKKQQERRDRKEKQKSMGV